MFLIVPCLALFPQVWDPLGSLSASRVHLDGCSAEPESRTESEVPGGGSNIAGNEFNKCGCSPGRDRPVFHPRAPQAEAWLEEWTFWPPPVSCPAGVRGGGGGGTNTIGCGNYSPKPNQDGNLVIYAYEHTELPPGVRILPCGCRLGNVSRRAGEGKALE